MKAKIFELSVFTALIICIISALSFSKSCDGIRGNLLRLHVIASGNTAEEQTLKLKVRDAVLDAGADVFSTNDTADIAAEKVRENLQLLENAAESEIRKNGYTYPVSIEITDCFFPTRTYENVTLPAGKYKAVKVIIGEGEGKNWWCVMFPPMCLPAARDDEAMLCDVLDEKSLDIVENPKKYEIRLWLVEKWEELKDKASRK